MIVGIAHHLVVTQAVTFMDVVKMDTLLLQLALRRAQYLQKQGLNIQPIVIIVTVFTIKVGTAMDHPLVVTQAIHTSVVVQITIGLFLTSIIA